MELQLFTMEFTNKFCINMINKKKICWQNYKPVAGCQQLTMKQIT